VVWLDWVEVRWWWLSLEGWVEEYRAFLGSLCLCVKVALRYLYEYHSDELVPWRWMIPVVYMLS